MLSRALARSYDVDAAAMSSWLHGCGIHAKCSGSPAAPECRVEALGGGRMLLERSTDVAFSYPTSLSATRRRFQLPEVAPAPLGRPLPGFIGGCGGRPPQVSRVLVSNRSLVGTGSVPRQGCAMPWRSSVLRSA